MTIANTAMREIIEMRSGVSGFAVFPPSSPLPFAVSEEGREGGREEGREREGEREREGGGEGERGGREEGRERGREGERAGAYLYGLEPPLCLLVGWAQLGQVRLPTDN